MKRKIISLILSVLMVFMLSAGAFAAEKKAVQYGTVSVIDEDTGECYGGVAILGDSVSRGCGASGLKPADDPTYYHVNNRIVESAYTYAVAKELGCDVVNDIELKGNNGKENYFTVAQVDELLRNSADDDEETLGNSYWPICSPGQTLQMTMENLGITAEDPNDDSWSIDQYYVGDMRRNYFTQDANAGYKTAAQRMLETSSLIVVQLGLNDVFTNGSSPLADGLGGGDVKEAVKEAIETLNKGYSYWLENYPKLIKTLKQWNPNASIVLVGYYNFLFNIAIDSDDLLPVGDLCSTLSAHMNSYLKLWSTMYDCTFVDIGNVETGAEYHDSLDLASYFAGEGYLISTHPSPDGYKYIARQVVNALPAEDGTKKQFSTNLSVDLCSVDGEITSVYINNLPKLECKYEFDSETHILNVKNLNPLATSLKVTYKTADGKTGYINYQLALGLNGFKAYRIYSTKNIDGILSKLPLYNLRQTLLSGFFAKFSK